MKHRSPSKVPGLLLALGLAFLACAPSWAETKAEELAALIKAANQAKTPIIVGAGPVGTALAIQLADLGYRPLVIDQRPDPAIEDPDSGRTFNITVANRALDALPEDVRDYVLSKTAPGQGRLMHLADGSQMRQPYGRTKDQVLHAIGRTEFNRILQDFARRRGVQFVFDTEVTAVDPKKGTIDTHSLTDNSTLKGVEVSMALGADGAASVLRKAIAEANGTAENLSSLDSGYKAFTLPVRADGKPVVRGSWLHLWPRQDIVVTGIPNADGSFSSILVMPNEGERSFKNLKTVEDYRRLFETEFMELLAIYPELPELLHSRPLGRVNRVDAEKWNYGDRFLILGDAAHAMSYFFGQGTNTGLEDTRLFRELIQRIGLKQAIATFGDLRRPATQAISDLSDDNKRVLTWEATTLEFNFRLDLERELVKQHPEYFRLRYELIIFSNLDFTYAKQRVDQQEAIMDELMGGHILQQLRFGKDVPLSEVDWKRASELIQARMKPIEGLAQHKVADAPNKPLRIEVIVGTDRPSSMSGKLAAIVAQKMSDRGAEVNTIDLSRLKLRAGVEYSQEPLTHEIEPYQARLDAADGIIFVVPTYNGSMPGSVKAFLDKLRHPDGLAGKSVAFVGQSGGEDGGRGAVQPLTNVVEYMKAQPFSTKAFFPRIQTQLTDDAKGIRDPVMEDRLDGMLQRFYEFAMLYREHPDAKAAKKSGCPYDRVKPIQAP